VKIQGIREMGLSELASRESRLREDLFTLRVQLASGQLKNVKQVWAVKKEIARVKTIAREKTLSDAGNPSER
jgi:large subunit ribosomal protein L29